MSNHPTQDELRGFWRAELDAGRLREVVLHLLHGCRRCGSLLAPEVKFLFGPPVVREEDSASRESDGRYDEVFERVFAALERQEPRAATIQAAPVPARRPGAAGGPVAELPGFEALLDRCQAIRHDDPAHMVELARFAAFSADRLDPQHYGSKQVADLRCRAWMELANAYRIAERLHDAEDSLEIAAECHVAGTGDQRPGVRLLEIQASLDADRRRFPEALAALDLVHGFHARQGDRHLAGRALLQKGLYACYDGDTDGAIRLIEQGLSQVDRKRDPGLVFGAVHNLSLSLVECGRLEEARALLGRNRPSEAGGRMDLLKVRWLEGRIDAGLGDLERAEQALEEVRLGFEAADLQYKAALAALELAAIHLRQGRGDDAQARALQAIGVFCRLCIGREALAALLILRDAFEQRAATASLLDGVIARLAPLERLRGA